MNDTLAPDPWSTAFTVSELSNKRPTTFELTPDAGLRALIAAELGVVKVSKLRFQGEITPISRSEWQLSAKLGATAVQECVVTLKPVTTRIDETTERRYMSKLPEIEAGSELEVPTDDTPELLGEVIDPGDVMLEELSLSLPDFPRADDAHMDDFVISEPGIAPIQDADMRPFAGLKSLADKMKKSSD